MVRAAHAATQRGVSLRAEDDFGWHLGVLLRAYQLQVTVILQGLPHGSRGYQILAAVVDGNQPTQLALAAFLGIDRSVMTYLIDDLVEGGLVERTQNPEDRRARKIVVTARGREVLSALEQQMRQAEDALLSSLDPTERTTLRSLLRRVACGLKDLETPIDPCETAG